MIQDFLITNWIEVSGVLISLIYLYFSIKQKIWLWPFGLLSAIFYIIVYFQSKFYADMGLQFYYFFISIYGWIIWGHGIKRDKGKVAELRIARTSSFIWLVISVLFLGFWFIIYIILSQFTDSDIPLWDALTTSASIIATWMLARKLIEHWILWIVIDLISLVLYIYKGLYPTSVLFAIYTLMAVIGYYSWLKNMRKGNR